MQEQVPKIMEAVIHSGALQPRSTKQVDVRAEKLPGWLIESFTIEAEPPFSTYERRYKGRKEFLIDVDPKKIHTDRYSALSTSWMVDACQKWTLAIREQFAADLKTSRMQIAPAQCHRLLTPERGQVFDVISFTAEVGEFVAADRLETAAEQFKNRYEGARSVYGAGIRLTEPQFASTTAIDGFSLAQVLVRRYTYASTFLEAEFGKRRLYDSYLLMLASSRALVIVQTFYPPDLKPSDLWQSLSIILQALSQSS